MITYSKFRPTGYDPAGLGCEDRQDWFVAPCAHNRDSDCLTESNWHAQLAMLEEADSKASTRDSDDESSYEVHLFGHWGPGWFEIVLVRPDTAVAKEAEEIEAALENYCVLDESDFSEREQAEADAVWQNCYREKDRIEYIRENRSQFEFQSMADLMGCVRGKFFAGYALELLS